MQRIPEQLLGDTLFVGVDIYKISSIVTLYELYGFTEVQLEVLAELMSDENDRMWGGAQFAE